MSRSEPNVSRDAILSAGKQDEPQDELEAWTPEEFDHFTDLGLLRRDCHGADGCTD